MNLEKHIRSIAGRLVAEGLTASGYTKAKAKFLTRNTAAPKFVHKMIDGFSPDIKREMKKMGRPKK